MTLAEIKREINLRLREVKADSIEYADTASYTTLQNLITKAIERVSRCTSGDELEAIDNLLGVIEDCYNDCRCEKDASASKVSLFDLHFELDVESEPSDTSDSKEDRDEERDEKTDEDSMETVDISKEIAEIEKNYEALNNQCNFINKMKLRSLRKQSIAALKDASDDTEIVSETYKIRRKFKKFSNRIDKAKRIKEAKPAYDELRPAKTLIKPNLARLVFGLITTVCGAAYGLFEARWWPWDNIAYAIFGIGVSYLILSIIYAIASTGESKTVVRRLCVMRLVLAIIFAIAILPVGLILENLGTLYMATIPFTLCGIAVYLIYRLKLGSLARKNKSK